MIDAGFMHAISELDKSLRSAFDDQGNVVREFSRGEWRRLPQPIKDHLRALKHARRQQEAIRGHGMAGHELLRPEDILPHQTSSPASQAGHDANAGNPPKPQPAKVDPAIALAAGTPFVDAVTGKPMHVVGLYRGGSVFIILSGPSINDLNLSLLHRRGITTLGVNNSPAIFRPNIWTYVDNPRKFHDAIWSDPAIIKSVHLRHWRKIRLHRKVADTGKVGKFDFAPLPSPNNPGKPAYPIEMPGVIGHHRNAFFNPDTWLSESSINWGNSKKSAKRNGRHHVLNVMFCAIKHAYALGFRTVYLLGCDFRMSEDRPYAFEQTKPGGGVAGNNRCYGKMDEMFRELRPRFDAAGFRVLNCYEKSGLRAFDFLPFDEAVGRATEHVPQEPIDTKNWYCLDLNQ